MAEKIKIVFYQGLRSALPATLTKGEPAYCTDTHQFFIGDATNAPKEVNPVQVSTMPSASATYANRIYQYVGTDETTYKTGHFYICSGSSPYAWSEVVIQKGLIVADAKPTTGIIDDMLYATKHYESVQRLGIASLFTQYSIVEGGVNETILFQPTVLHTWAEITADWATWRNILVESSTGNAVRYGLTSSSDHKVAYYPTFVNLPALSYHHNGSWNDAVNTDSIIVVNALPTEDIDTKKIYEVVVSPAATYFKTTSVTVATITYSASGIAIDDGLGTVTNYTWAEVKTNWNIIEIYFEQTDKAGCEFYGIVDATEPSGYSQFCYKTVPEVTTIKLYYRANNQWNEIGGGSGASSSDAVSLYDKATESINGSSSSATSQKDINVENAAAINAKIPFFGTMPTAGSEYAGKIVQYVGTTTTDYIHGYFYECTGSGSSYTWEQAKVQSDDFIPQLSVFPTYSESAPKSFQYIGSETGYAKWQFYKKDDTSYKLVTPTYGTLYSKTLPTAYWAPPVTVYDDANCTVVNSNYEFITFDNVYYIKPVSGGGGNETPTISGGPGFSRIYGDAYTAGTGIEISSSNVISNKLGGEIGEREFEVTNVTKTVSSGTATTLTFDNAVLLEADDNTYPLTIELNRTGRAGHEKSFTLTVPAGYARNINMTTSGYGYINLHLDAINTTVWGEPADDFSSGDICTMVIKNKKNDAKVPINIGWIPKTNSIRASASASNDLVATEKAVADYVGTNAQSKVVYSATEPSSANVGDIWVNETDTESDVSKCYNPTNIVTKAGNLFSFSGLTESLEGDPFIFYDTHTNVVRCEATISVRTTSARSIGFNAWGVLTYGGVNLPSVYGAYGGCYTEDAPVSYAWNSGSSALYMRFHSAFATGKLIKFTVTLYFQRSVLVTAGVLSTI